MDCQAVYELMNRYIDDEITPEEERVLEFHLERCRDCQKTFGEFKDLNLLLNSLEPSKNFTNNVMAKIQKSKQFNPNKWIYIHRKSLIGVAAVFLLFVLVLAPWSNNKNSADIIISQGQVERGITPEGNQAVTVRNGEVTIKGLNGTFNAINSQIILEKTTADLKSGLWGQFRYKIQNLYFQVKGWFTNTFGKGEMKNENN